MVYAVVPDQMTVWPSREHHWRPGQALPHTHLAAYSKPADQASLR